MYGQRDYHAKCSQTEKEKYHMISTDNVESKKKKKLIYKTEKNSQTQRKLMVTKGDEGTGKDKVGFGD